MYILCEASGKPASCYSSGGDGDEVSRMMGRRKAAVYQGRAATMSPPPSKEGNWKGDSSRTASAYRDQASAENLGCSGVHGPSAAM